MIREDLKPSNVTRIVNSNLLSWKESVKAEYQKELIEQLQEQVEFPIQFSLPFNLEGSERLSEYLLIKNNLIDILKELLKELREIGWIIKPLCSEDGRCYFELEGFDEGSN